MVADHRFRDPEFRQKVTDGILEMLAGLAEAHMKIFIWNHYRGYQTERIAEILRCSPAEVETTLGAINSILYHKIRGLLAEDPQLDAERNLHGRVMLKEGAAASVTALSPAGI
jgi:DNA-directed RNA polymerase specialized sigma24 family protein